MKVHYTVYKVTNTINGKIYVGAHKTSDLDDGYMGSGKVIKSAIKKHGIDNFIKEVLHTFENSEDMYKMESTLVNEDFVKSQETYNLKVGGFGGFDYVNETGLNHLHDNRKNSLENLKLGTKAFSEKCKNDKVFHKQVKERLSKLNDLVQKANPNGTFKGKSHSDEAKKKIGEKNSLNQLGTKNSQFGLVWVYHLEEQLSKKITKEELPNFIKDGWLKGRKMKF